MKLLLLIKNGQAKERKVAMRTLTDRAPHFGPAPLFNQVLPLLMSPSLEDQERHLLVKVIDRILFKLQERVRPFCHRILMVIVPMLIDEDYYARVEGREIIANLAKAGTMLFLSFFLFHHYLAILFFYSSSLTDNFFFKIILHPFTFYIFSTMHQPLLS